MQKTESVWLDGAFVPWDAAQVHVLTHTLHYGLGVFEGIRCYQTDDGRSAVGTRVPSASGTRSNSACAPPTNSLCSQEE